MKQTLIGLWLLTMSGCGVIQWPQTVTSDFTNFEQIGDSLWVQVGDQYVFTPADMDTFALSGRSSLLAKAGRSVALEYRVEKPEPDSKYFITVWSRSSGKNNGGAIAVFEDSSGHSVELARTSDPADLHRGWKLMELLVQLPPNFKGTRIVVQLINNGDDPVWFDELKIEFLEKVYYPDFESHQTIDIQISEPDLIRLDEKRTQAFAQGYIEMSSADWMRADIHWEGEQQRGNLTIKGDKLYNLTGDKWSFKMELDDGDLRGMRYFSVHNPENQQFLNEWLFHRLLQDEGVVCARYGFAPLRLNDRSLGVYAFEERIIDEWFVHQDTINVIARFRDIGFARDVEVEEGDLVEETNKVFENSDIQIFREDSFDKKRTKALKNSIERFRNIESFAANDFNKEKTARMLALCDLLGAYSALHWTNIRFISNTENELMELVGNDGFTAYDVRSFGEGPFMAWSNSPLKLSPERWQAMYLNLFNDAEFLEIYLIELDRLVSDDFLNTMKLQTYSEMKNYQNMLTAEWPAYRFEYAPFYERARAIRKALKTFHQFRKENPVRYGFLPENGL